MGAPESRFTPCIASLTGSHATWTNELVLIDLSPDSGILETSDGACLLRSRIGPASTLL